MVTQVTCPHCRELVDLDDETKTSCPHCAGKLRPRPGAAEATEPQPAEGGDIDAPMAVSTRVLGANLEPVESHYNLERSPASEASFGGNAVVNENFLPNELKTDRRLKRPPRGVTTKGVDDPRTVEREAAKTQARTRKTAQFKSLGLVIAVITVLVLIAGAVVMVLKMRG
jgi:hypothetical protein